MTNTITMTNTFSRDMIHQMYLDIVASREELASKIDTTSRTVKSRFKNAMNAIFDCSRENPYNLPADIQSKMFLY